MAKQSRLTFQKAIKPMTSTITEAIAKATHKEHRGKGINNKETMNIAVDATITFPTVFSNIAEYCQWPRRMGWGGRWEGGSGWGTHVNPWLIHVSVWQKPLQYCKVISLQLIKINGKKDTWMPGCIPLGELHTFPSCLRTGVTSASYWLKKTYPWFEWSPGSK